MAVEARQVQIRQRQRMLDHTRGLARLDGGAKFGIHLASVNGVVGVGVDARGQSQQELLADARLPGDDVNGVQLLSVVDDKAADALGNGVGDVLVGLVIAVKIGRRKVGPGLQCGINFAAGDNVDPQPLLGDDPALALLAYSTRPFSPKASRNAWV